MFLPRNPWDAWGDAPSSSDDDSILSDVVPKNCEEAIEQFVRRGELYSQRKLQRKLRRLQEERRLLETPPKKYFSDLESDEEEFSDSSMKKTKRARCTSGSRRRVAKRRNTSGRERRVAKQRCVSSTLPKIATSKKMVGSVVRKDKAPVVRKLPPDTSDDEDEYQFCGGDVVPVATAAMNQSFGRKGPESRDPVPRSHCLFRTGGAVRKSDLKDMVDFSDFVDLTKDE
jgi:hypothetical protein